MSGTFEAGAIVTNTDEKVVLNRESATGAVFDFDNESSVAFAIKGVTANATYYTSK